MATVTLPETTIAIIACILEAVSIISAGNSSHRWHRLSLAFPTWLLFIHSLKFVFLPSLRMRVFLTKNASFTGECWKLSYIFCFYTILKVCFPYLLPKLSIYGIYTFGDLRYLGRLFHASKFYWSILMTLLRSWANLRFSHFFLSFVT